MHKTSSPIISVIVPVYNAVATLDRCVQSILNQTYTDFELILVNDGSKDNSGSLCDSYALRDERVRVFHKENGGASSARNLGLDEAQGVWVTFCDADDWVDSSWLMNYVEQTGDYDLLEQGIRFDKSLISESIESSCAGMQYVGTVKNFLNEMANLGIVGYTVIKCFRRSIIELHNLRFDTRFNYHEDEEFVVRYLLYCKNVVSVETPGYNYIMPVFESKYPSVKNGYYLYRSLYTCILEIVPEEFTKYTSYTLNSMLYYFVLEFREKGFMQKWRFMRSNRRLMLSHILKSNIFYPIKLAIFVDLTGLFASMLLTMYLMLKRISVTK